MTTTYEELYPEGLPDPISREEYFLAAAAGMDVGQLPEPITRRERYLARIAAGGRTDSGGETAGTAAAAVAIHDASGDAHGDLRQELRTLSEGIPTAVHAALKQAAETGEFQGEDGYTPVKGKDYFTDEEKEEWEAWIGQELAKRGQLKPEFANSIDECTDTTKLYVLSDGMIYAYVLTEIENGPAYTNQLPISIKSDKTAYVGANGEKGYNSHFRISSSGVEKAATGYYATGFIPVKAGDTVRIKGMNGSDGNEYCVAYYAADDMVIKSSISPTYTLLSLTADGNNVRTFSPANADTAYMRLTFMGNPADIIITVNEEITESSGTTTGYAWASTGHAFVPADYEDRIVELETLTAEHSEDIENLKNGAVDVTDITEWDAPIYDANIPVFQLSAEKAAMTNAAQTPADIYSKYDALMAKHPHYITKTDLGLCSDGVNHVYRYDFREPDSRNTSGMQWSETKTKAIIVSGIHYEWAGIYGLYYALEEIAENPELYSFRRNSHLIVVPCMNPYATIAGNYSDSVGVKNANGVEIHRNFEVGWVLTEAGTTHYGGAEPLSELETQYVDAIMQENTDAALFLTCHSFADESFNFIWPSTATPYMCNMGYRLIDKLSNVWMNKYGEELVGLEDYRTSDIPSWDNRLGFAHISATPGTETRQGTKYGIQSANVEINGRFWVHGTKASPEQALSAFTMSRGAEVYVNVLLTTFGVYDPKDKALYGGKELA